MGPILPLFYLYFIQHLAFALDSNTPSPYSPIKEILLACGSSGSFNSSDGRTWTGDINSSYFLPSFEPKNNVSRVSKAAQQACCPEKYYLQARLSYSRFTYLFNVTAGKKFIRLYFYPSSYPNFDRFKDLFSVKAGSFTLLRNFSASLTAAAPYEDNFFKEYCINVEEEGLKITFIPTRQNVYVFINAIEIVSMPDKLYYSRDGKSLKFINQVNPSYYIQNSNALETLYRINVGWSSLSAMEDTGMYRTWISDDDYWINDARRPPDYGVNMSIQLNFSVIPNYTAPAVIYKTARGMGLDNIFVMDHLFRWEFPVDSNFTYFVRLHFCQFLSVVKEIGDMVFEIYIANQSAESGADIIRWTGGNGVPIYKDYAVKIESKGIQKKQNLSIAFHPLREGKSKFPDAILNGLEIFKVDNNGNLAVSNSDIRNRKSSPSPKSMELPKNKSNHALIVSIIGGLVPSFILLAVLIFFIFRQRRKTKASVSGAGISLGPFSSPKSKSSKAGGSSQPSDNLYSHFSLAEIKVATNNFDDILIIGVGGFGNVYKGWFINDEAIAVAIKRLNPGSQQGALEFKTEIEMLSQLRHRHLVSLIGYCDDDGEMILVYDYMARGTLRDHLYNSNNPPLPWIQRLQICIGAARGLHYLHTGAKRIIIHRDVKTTNILLDEKWVAKVSDFGLSKIGTANFSQTHISTMVKGTFGYLDPDYFLLQQLTEKSDVYSFGVVLFEVLCARPPLLRTEDRKQANLAVWARECHNNGMLDQIVDLFLNGKIAPECLSHFAEVAISCLDEDRNRRPSMSEVVYSLEFALRLQISREKDAKIGRHDHISLHHLDKGKTTLESYTTDDSGLIFSNLDW